MRILFLNQAPKGVDGKKAHYNVEKIEKLLNGYASPGTKIEVGFPDDFEGAHIIDALGGQSALNGLHHMMEVPAIVRKIFWAAENGYDAVIQSNTFDPGVDGGRLAVNIPVIGLLRTTMHAALNLADKVGFTVPLAPHVPYTKRILRAYGLEQFVAGMKPIGIYGLDLDKRKDEIFEKTAALIRDLMKEGAEIIIPLGGAIIPYVVDPLDLQRECGIQVLNTKAIGIRFAEMCVALGMTQSPVTYPRFKLKAEDFTARI